MFMNGSSPTTDAVGSAAPPGQVDVVIVGGSSGVAPRHLEAFDAHPATRVGALVEPKTDRADRLRAAHPDRPVVDDIPSAPERATGLAVVCVPDAAHAAVVAGCLDRGWHVLCEKPLTDDLGVARDLFAHAERAGRYLRVAYQRRFMLRELERELVDGALGAVHCVDTRWLRREGHPDSRRTLARRGSGVRGDLIPHLLSQTLPFLGRGPLSIQARDWQVDSGWSSEDVARLIVRDGTGAELKIDATYDSPHLDRPDDCWLEIYGARGAVHVEMPTDQDEEWTASHPPMLYPRSGQPVALDPLPTVGQCHLRQADHVVRALRRGPASPEERERELALVRVMAAAHASAAWSGSILPVDSAVGDLTGQRAV